MLTQRGEKPSNVFGVEDRIIRLQDGEAEPDGGNELNVKSQRRNLERMFGFVSVRKQVHALN